MRAHSETIRKCPIRTRIETRTPEPIEEGAEDRLRVVRRVAFVTWPARQQEYPDRRLHLGVLAPERAQDHGLDEAPDGVAVGVVGAELGALVGVQATLEQVPKMRG